MSDNYSDEIKPLLKLLRTPAFRFIIVCYNHYNPVRRLEQDIRQHFPDRPFFKTNAQKTNYQNITSAYFELGEGFFWIENFDDVLDEERNSLGQETPQMVQNNERRRHITAGLNLRRDKLAKLPIAFFILVPASNRELYVRSIMKKMPDLWSFRSIIIDLSIDLTQLPRIPQEIQSLDLLPVFENTTLGGETIEEKQAELERLTTALSSVPEHEQAYRNTLIQQINELNRYIEGVTKGVISERSASVINSKNVVSGSTIHAGRDIHIGDKKEEHYHHYGDRKIPRALTANPFQPEVFLGREADLQAIHDQLFSGDNLLLLVNGVGGVGKTSIASRYYHIYQHKYAHTAWLLSEKSIANALLLLADPLGLQFDERMGTEGRLELLLTAMANLEKPCLLVLDNANELPDLDANYQALRRLSNVHLLLTTRISNFEKAEKLSIDGLPEAEALALFEGYYRPLGDEERALFFQIREAVGGNTLVIELLAKNLAIFNKLKTNYALGALLADLQEKGLLRLTRSQEVRTDYQSKGGQMRREKPEDVIAAMYDLGELPREEVALLSVFAVLPAESIGFETLEGLLPGLENLETGLLALAQKGWIEYNEAGNAFKCSPVVQKIVRWKNAELRADCAVLVDALNEKLDYESGTGRMLNAVNAEALHFVHYAESVVLNWPEPTTAISKLAGRVGHFHKLTGNLDRALYHYQRKVQVNEALYAFEPDNLYTKRSLAISYSECGSIYFHKGDFKQAIALYETSHKIFRELYESYPQFKNDFAISYERLGDTHLVMGNLEQALTFFEEYNLLKKELYETFLQDGNFKDGLAVSYGKLGDIHTEIGKLEQALTFFRQFNDLAKELYEDSPQNMYFKDILTVSYGKLGETHYALGNLDQALTFFDQANKLAGQLYDDFPQNVSFKNRLAASYSKLGVLYRDQGDKAKAKAYFHECYPLWKSLSEAHPSYAEFRKNFEWVKNALEEMGD